MLIGNRIPWRTGSTSRTAWILAVRATPLKHEPLNNAVKMESVVVSIVDQFEEVSCCDWHAISEQLNLDVTLACSHQNFRHNTEASSIVFESVPRLTSDEMQLTSRLDTVVKHPVPLSDVPHRYWRSHALQ